MRWCVAGSLKRHQESGTLRKLENTMNCAREELPNKANWLYHCLIPLSGTSAIRPALRSDPEGKEVGMCKKVKSEPARTQEAVRRLQIFRLSVSVGTALVSLAVALKDLIG